MESNNMNNQTCEEGSSNVQQQEQPVPQVQQPGFPQPYVTVYNPAFPVIVPNLAAPMVLPNPPPVYPHPPTVYPTTFIPAPPLMPQFFNPMLPAVHFMPPTQVVDDSLSPFIPMSRSVSSSSQMSSCSTGSTGSCLMPLLPVYSDRSRSASVESAPPAGFPPLNPFMWSDRTEDSSTGAFEEERGHKQQLIVDVREKLEQLLGQYFHFKMERNIMTAFAHLDMPELAEKDVLRGENVGNIRAKSKPSLNALVEFLQRILNSGHAVHRVDVILQKKKNEHLKGLLVNIQFSSRNELLQIRDDIWIGQGFDEKVKKFAPAVFAQDCSWQGLPTDLHFDASEGDIRIQNPLPEKLHQLGLEAGCRVKSMSVITKSGSGKKAKTVEIPRNQFHYVLSEGKYTVKGGVTRSLSERTTLTISFEEDWKTNFWRSKRTATFPEFLYEQNSPCAGL